MIKTLTLSILLALASPAAIVSGAAPSASAESFQNPVIWADVPDPDVIRVGDSYYMVSTTMHLMPGCPVMRSADLVNWTTIGYVFDELTDNPRYDLLGGTVYGKGQWATSLRYHDGKFYALFSPNDEPYKSYIYSTTDPAGKWELVSRLDHFHDSSLFFDDDGRVYVFSGSGDIRLRELEPDLSAVKEGGVDQVVISPDPSQPGLHEGSRVVKHDGKYYAMVIAWPAGQPRRQLCYRADSITGPYERKVVLQSEFGGFPYVGQGCLVDGADGDWWGMIFQDRGGVGRILTLNPCRWVDGWPMLGDEDGKVPATVSKSIVSGNGAVTVESDEFADGNKSILWEWNHNDIPSAWSLTERPGHLRLTTARVVGNLFEAPNTITQRMEGPGCEGEIKIDVSGMKPGDVAGFAAFNGDSGLLSVVKDSDGATWLCASTSSVALGTKAHEVASVADEEIERIPLGGPVVHLKINADFSPGRDIATFAYSTDGSDWKSIGKDFKMVFDYRRFFMGTRFAIYNYATASTGGYVDVDYFKYSRL
ncbi:MAG: family 43 glycosylhydrolase [Staphylococcus sp.]|nr:family 43 glycosylhydrolase [Staphylococcus sp.]